MEKVYTIEPGKKGDLKRYQIWQQFPILYEEMEKQKNKRNMGLHSP